MKLNTKSILLTVTIAAAAASCRTTGGAAEVKDSSQGGNYQSGRIGTYEQFLYGAFETRMQGGKGEGVITPFYLYKLPAPSNDKGWQEMDFELFGKNGGFQTQVLTPGNPRTEHAQFTTFADGEKNGYDGYHTYRMEWTPTALRFIVDGKLLREETDPVEYAKLLGGAEPMVLFVQLWAGTSDWSGHFDGSVPTAFALLNYVQVETYTPGKGPNGSDFTLNWRDDFSYLNTKRWGLSHSQPSDGAVNGYQPSQVSTKNNNLVLYLSN